MSGNINDTNVDKLKSEINSLINDLDNIINLNSSDLDKKKSIEYYESNYQNKYKHLFTTSKTLWNYIFTQYKTNSFNKQVFQKNLDMMLSAILKIQQSKISQYEASTVIGEEIASQYIPQLNK
jgi:hypothetical protein